MVATGFTALPYFACVYACYQNDVMRAFVLLLVIQTYRQTCMCVSECKLPAMKACTTIAGSKTGMTHTRTGPPGAAVELVTISVAVLVRERDYVCECVHLYG